MRRHPFHVLVAVVYAVVLLFIGFWPSPVDEDVDVLRSWPVQALVRLGLTPLDGYGIVEFAANVALFAPFGWVGMTLVRRATWWGVTACGCLVSVSLEVGQQVLRPDRFATTSDVVANTVGAFVGSLLAAWALRRGRAPGPRRVAVPEG